ncbi:hypothetical protein PC510_003808 [Escherichia coli]|uniref:hypothetical protein n=1 Tax=Escherichia coli TaxID=562 RepID=UPI000A19BA36|nr:hypothetical protein [Escherichia coli]EKI3096534.1 hypothetical protein [Escherichia coli]MBB9841033.1 hypothetical protein [Escherichia coli]MBS9328459.1 hypothetical protein [Escherichia coli]
MKVKIIFEQRECEIDFAGDSPTEYCECRVTNESESVSKADLADWLVSMSLVSGGTGRGFSEEQGAEAEWHPATVLLLIEFFGGSVVWPAGWKEELQALEDEMEDAVY